MALPQDNKPNIMVTMGFYLIIMTVWTLIWWLKVHYINQVWPWLSQGWGDFGWWTAAKLVIWVLPAWWFMTWIGLDVASIVTVKPIRNIIIWGGGIGLIIAATGIIPAWLGSSLHEPTVSLALVGTVLLTPLIEEFVARGALLGSLKLVMPFWQANIVAAVLFLGMHIPGWYFMGTLTENMIRPIGGGLSILILGVAFGYASHRAKSILGGTLAHAINNLTATLLR